MPRADLRRAMRERMALSVAESEARHRALLSALPEGVVLHDTDGSLLLANPAACTLLGLTPPTPAGDATDQGVPNPRLPQPGERPAPEDGPGSTSAGTPGDHPYGYSDALRRLSEVASMALSIGQAQHDVIIKLMRAHNPQHLRVTAVPLLSDDGHPQAVVTTFTGADPGPSDGQPASITLPGPGPGSWVDLDAGTPRVTQAPPAGLPPAPRTSTNTSTNTSISTGSTGTSSETGRSQDMFRLSMQHSPIGFAVATLNGRFLRVNRKLCRMLGYRSDELQERTIYQIIHPDDLDEASLQIGQLIRGDIDAVALERRYVGNGGMQLWGMLSITLMRDANGAPQQFVVQIEDVSEIHQAQQLLTHMTLHDSLTGMPNRTLVLDRIQKALDRAHRSGRRVAVLLCDVDHFRIINDSAGHEQGDAVLVEIGRRMARALRPGDTAGRLGGDEFVVVCEDVADEQEAVIAAERIQRLVTEPLRLGEHTLRPTLSIGIAVATASDEDPMALLRDADLATYRAKDRGRNRWDLVDGGLRRRAMERLGIEHALRSGLENGELRLHFQPIVDLTTRALLGREALLRWDHPEHGLLAPVHFLQVAEEAGLIGEIGQWVLHEAARAAAASPPSSGYVSINVSPSQVAQAGLAGQVEKALADAGLPSDRLIIELTESVMLSEAPSARQEIELLDAQGVRIVVDDFGTGFSALSYLRDLPVSGIKVDRSFTTGLGQADGQCERIIEALTGLGHGLGVDVVVEGVETEEQSAMLADLGAQHAQGYLFGRPSPAFTPA